MKKAMIAFKTICVMAFFIPNWLFASVLVWYWFGEFAGRIYSFFCWQWNVLFVPACFRKHNCR